MCRGRSWATGDQITPGGAVCSSQLVQLSSWESRDGVKVCGEAAETISRRHYIGTRRIAHPRCARTIASACGGDRAREAVPDLGRGGRADSSPRAKSQRKILGLVERDSLISRAATHNLPRYEQTPEKRAERSRASKHASIPLPKSSAAASLAPESELETLEIVRSVHPSLSEPPLRFRRLATSICITWPANYPLREFGCLAHVKPMGRTPSGVVPASRRLF